MLFSPKSINSAFKKAFAKRDWNPIRVPCAYPTTYFLENYKIRSKNRGAFREMDFVKDKLGIRSSIRQVRVHGLQRVRAKMTIFHNLGHINHGIEIVPVKAFADEMSTGVSYYEQFLWDLESRGVL